MTVSSTTSRKSYTGDNSTTSFATNPVVFFDSTDLTVYVVVTATGVSETLVLNTDYTVTGGDGSTGTVNLAGGSDPYGAPLTTQKVVIVRTIPRTQAADFVNNDGSDADVAEEALDRLTMIVQEHDTLFDRTFTLADSDVSGVSLEMPTPAASELIGFNADADALTTYPAASIADSIIPTSYIETLLDDSTAAEAATTLAVIAKAIGTTKGDTIAWTASATPVRKAVGSNGQVRMADSAQSDGWSNAYLPMVQEFRLTLTTAVPVTTTDVTGATTVYCTPYKGNRIALYDGSGVWNVRASAQFSLALGTLSSGKPYDVFCYDNSGTPTLEFLVWTNDTTRATALTYQDGVLVKTGATTRRYLGTFYTTSTTETEDSLAKRFLWNYYHRVRRPMKRVDATNSWTYSTAAWQQANAAAANQLDYVCGVAEDSISCVAVGNFQSDQATFRDCATGVGVDATNANSAQVFTGSNSNSTTGRRTASAHYEGIPGVGRHYLAWLEYGAGSDTQTWYGDNNAAYIQTGIAGSVFA